MEVANLVITWPYINEMYSARDVIHQLMHTQGTITVAFDPRVIKITWSDGVLVVLFNNKTSR